MIITRPRDWARILGNLAEVNARSVFIIGCGQCATVANTGGEPEVLQAKDKLEAEGYTVTGWTVGEVVCHSGSTRLETRRHSEGFQGADVVLVLSCGAGVQTVADATSKPVFPGLESAFLGNIVRHGVFEERCQMCGDCVLDLTGGICPVTTCPKGLLNGPCGGMWNGMCEVLTDRECTHVRIQRRLAAQGRTAIRGMVPPKDHSVKLKPGSVNVRGRQANSTRSVTRLDAIDKGEGDR
ncbi:MAG: methylenetetrahydrofolate reductase C-terminal domain-containing protein [Coriobacteriia bacterium]|jgi:ferredoxin|nr:methylenetetrahydrofolate reductase C-terminal domain-containing protein [Coriobacteriia bacterium]